MPKILAPGLVLSPVLALAACASAPTDLATLVAQSRAAGQPVLIYKLDVALEQTKDVMPGTTYIGLVNTGAQAVKDISLTMQAYKTGIPLKNPDGSPLQGNFDLSGSIPAGGVPPDTGFNGGWKGLSTDATCMRVTHLTVALADGSSVNADGDDVDRYLVPFVNRHCAKNAPNSPDLTLPPSYNAMM